MSKVCLICGKQSLSIKTGEYHFDPPENIPGGEMVMKDATWEECGNCGERILSADLEARLEKERYKRLGLLLPEEIKEIRKRAGLSQTEIAKVLGIGEKTYTRWESGFSLQNKSSDNLIRLMDMNAELFAQLEAERSPERNAQVAEYIHALQDLKGKNELAVAAHGGELDNATAKALRDGLLRIIDFKKKFGN